MKRHFLSFCGLLLTVSHAFFSFGQTPTPQPVPKPLNENAIIVRQDVAEALTVIQKSNGMLNVASLALRIP